MRPLTNILPKELLPLGRKPALEYIVEELQSVGVRTIVFVVSSAKTAIRDYFGDSTADGRIRFQYVVQEKQSGLADAILQAQQAVGKNRFIVALGDTVIVSGQQMSPLGRLVSVCREQNAFSGVSVERVPIRNAYMYGMVKPCGDPRGGAFEIDGVVEKPRVEDSPSDYAIGGRYVFDPGIFELIRETRPGVGGEQQITDSIALAISKGYRVWCAPLVDGENRYDIGNFAVYSEAFTAFCMQDEELAHSVMRAVCRSSFIGQLPIIDSDAE
jgi:UTP--glucose-1-phosphate uridylyltransferase